MQGTYVSRQAESVIGQLLQEFPVIALLGPRQSGKSTLVQHFIEGRKDCVYLDLELPSDQRKLSDPELYFKMHQDELICMDEIQRFPGIFEIMRSRIDQNHRNGQFIILGSASRDLIKQSSETLAGRIAYIELSPFQFNELFDENANNKDVLQQLWLRGGFPRSYLAMGEAESFRWREQFVRTFLERDIPQLGIQIPALTMRRLWQMCTHYQGQMINASKIGQSLGYSHVSIRRQLDVLEQTFMIRLVPPFEANVKKRLVKTPKIYLRDTGILHALLDIETQEQLFGHPVFGASWEGLAIESILNTIPNWQYGFYRTSAGAELDLIIQRGGKSFGFEFKASSNPQVNRGFWNAIDDLNLEHVWIVAPVNESYPIKENVTITSLGGLLTRLSSMN